MNTSLILEAFVSVLLEKGLEALGRPLRRLTKRVWHRLHKAEPQFSSDPSAITSEQVPQVSAALDELADQDPQFQRLLESWKDEVVGLRTSAGPITVSTNRVSGVNIGSHISQSNQIGGGK